MNKNTLIHVLAIAGVIVLFYLLWKPLLFLGMAWGLIGAVWGKRTNKKQLINEGLTTFVVCLLLYVIF